MISDTNREILRCKVMGDLEEAVEYMQEAQARWVEFQVLCGSVIFGSDWTTFNRPRLGGLQPLHCVLRWDTGPIIEVYWPVHGDEVTVVRLLPREPKCPQALLNRGAPLTLKVFERGPAPSEILALDASANSFELAQMRQMEEGTRRRAAECLKRADELAELLK